MGRGSWRVAGTEGDGVVEDLGRAHICRAPGQGEVDSGIAPPGPHQEGGQGTPYMAFAEASCRRTDTQSGQPRKDRRGSQADAPIFQSLPPLKVSQ